MNLQFSNMDLNALWERMAELTPKPLAEKELTLSEVSEHISLMEEILTRDISEAQKAMLRTTLAFARTHFRQLSGNEEREHGPGNNWLETA